MANKMFYTAEEAAAKLNKTTNQVLDMAKKGEIQEFRDRDRVMFKVEQINLLAGGDEGDIPLALEDSRHGDSEIDLADTSGERSRAGGRTAPKAQRDVMVDSNEETGISAFDASRYGQDKDSGKGGSRAGSKAGSGELSLESVGSGSGLLDLTRENDDSLSGAALIEDAFQSEEEVQLPANASGLFDAAGAESGGNAVTAGGMQMMPMMVEAYDGSWSGLGVGLMVGAFAALICTFIIAAVAVTGAVPALATTFTSNLAVWGGGLLAVTIVCGGVGFFIGRATE